MSEVMNEQMVNEVVEEAVVKNDSLTVKEKLIVLGFTCVVSVATLATEHFVVKPLAKAIAPKVKEAWNKGEVKKIENKSEGNVIDITKDAKEVNDDTKK